MSTITHESEEMYLETIYRLKCSGKLVKQIDIAHELNYTKPSVSIGMKSLLEKRYIIIKDNKSIDLTESGLSKACSVYERHVVLMDVLTYMGASKELAEEDGCKIEHVISDELLEVLKNYLKKINEEKK